MFFLEFSSRSGFFVLVVVLDLQGLANGVSISSLSLRAIPCHPLVEIGGLEMDL